MQLMVPENEAIEQATLALTARAKASHDGCISDLFGVMCGSEVWKISFCRTLMAVMHSIPRLVSLLPCSSGSKSPRNGSDLHRP